MFNKTKTDPELGRRVHAHLVKMGVETPMEHTVDYGDRKEKIDLIEQHFRSIMQILSLDLADDSLAETPKRVAKMLVNETMWGLDYEAFPKCTTVVNKMQYDEMVVEKQIRVGSNCEHHFQPIVGFAHIAYIPNTKVLGLSKMPRIVEYFSKRPQIQERLTEQIFHALSYILETEHVAVTLVAEHMCVSQRGVEDQTANTTTAKLGGCFKSDRAVRDEYFKHIYS